MNLNRNPFLIKFSFLFCIVLGGIVGSPVLAQLTANFTADKEGGCSPLSIKFTNTSTGASAAATWQWNFGNGNSSTLKDPGASYFTEKAYTVTLTAKDGAVTSVKSITITVYKKPTVDFSVTPAKGCAPLLVNFTANAQAGDGTIANYLWDFGDGANVQGAGFASTQHTYNFAQAPPITLNVTNSFGCYSTVTKNNQVEVVIGVQAAFTPSTTTVCKAGDSVAFTNNSTGSGTLTYAWDFGDAKTSTEKSPTHAYAASGNFIAKLTTTSSDGCSSTVQSATINVANFKADFEVPALICLNQQVIFSNKSTNPFDRADWYIDDFNYGSSYYSDGSFPTSFSAAGGHTVKLDMHYGSCTTSITKTITVNTLPKLDGFIVDLQGACGVPLTINYKDTSSDAVGWKWQNSYYGNTFATTKTASYMYTYGSSEYVYLTTTNAAGCSATVGKYVNYEKPNVYIRLTNSNIYQGCKPITVGFAATPDTAVATYKWNFGDGSAISTEVNPTHIFTTAGSFVVTLSYTTPTGCTGTVTFNSVTVVDKPVFDFKASQTTICGNTPDTLTAIPNAGDWNYSWLFNDEYGYYYGNGTIVKQFTYDTTITVRMIATKYGCTDTVIKTNYLKVLPPFPKIQQVLNTCDGKRGDVRFTETSQKALKWNWDFGDGSSENYNSFKDTIRHTYAATKAYKVVLSASNGGCTVRDSTTAYVLLKQQPLLSSTKNSVCGSDVPDFRLSGFDTNPYYNNSYNSYVISSKEYGDFTTSFANVYIPSYYWNQEVSGTLQSLDPGKSDLRMITTSVVFGCNDTSNFMPLKIRGPRADFIQEPHSGCFKNPVRFTDTSTYLGTVRIVRWDWDFGDGQTQTLTTNGSVSHTYNRPGTFYISLKVTDADGCFNSTGGFSRYVTVSGPKADFVASSYIVPPNTVVNFTNTSADYYSYYGATLQWKIKDSAFSTEDYATSLNFVEDGIYPIRLITKNTISGCTDTMVKNITVRKVNSAFTFALSYINNNACPPVIATFTSNSTNAVRLSWDFGDGGIAGNNRIVTHTYNKPGIYRVVHYSFDSNIGVDSTEDFIEVKGPYALLKADQLTGCSSLQVKLTAEVKYASNYSWDFGDGTVVPTTDTFAVHNYVTPGIYVPALILKDAGGCTATSELPEKVIVDSLSGKFKLLPAIICDSAVSVFTASAYSLSNDQLRVPIKYTWVVKEGLLADTLYTEAASHRFTKPGAHTIQLTISTPYGCQQAIADSVQVKQGISASIIAANKICRTDSIGFVGNALPTNAAYIWKWDFKNGNTAATQNPLPQQYNTAGPQQISLIVSNGFCTDTAYHSLLVNALPVVGILPANPFVCKGSAITITASGGNTYQWTATTPIANANAAAISINPTVTTNYLVKVTDVENCSSKDSITVKVIAPMQVTASNSLFACQGKSVQLTVSGADTYKWIGDTSGLSNNSIANPTALATASTTYTVVGYDNYNCFTDTATVAVRISPLPVVDAGNGKQLISGASFTMAPIVSGAANYQWTPTDYLSCITCLNPISTPKASMVYTLTATNIDGCKASDTIQLRLACASSLVFIPTAFSPNNDQLNDRFTITGSGIQTIQSIVIFSRYGKKIFERKNIAINDRNNSWDGTINGEPASFGAYVYTIQATCESGEKFNFKGTVMLVR